MKGRWLTVSIMAAFGDHPPLPESLEALLSDETASTIFLKAECPPRVKAGHISQLRLDNRQLAMDNLDWIMDIGQWTLDIGQWTMDNGHWTLDNGEWIIMSHSRH